MTTAPQTAALERDTMLCGIYARRPTICRDFEMGGSECREERLKIPALSNDGRKPLHT